MTFKILRGQVHIKRILCANKGDRRFQKSLRQRASVTGARGEVPALQGLTSKTKCRTLCADSISGGTDQNLRSRSQTIGARRRSTDEALIGVLTSSAGASN